MLLTESAQPFLFAGGTSGFMDHQLPGQTYGSSLRRKSHARSMSSFSTSSSNAPLRLADVAKQHGMGIHVDNWREDMFPVRQYLPMQHIIGSLKRDRDEQVQFVPGDDVPAWRKNQRRRQSELTAASPRSEDSFLHMLRTPKRRRTSNSSHTGSQCTTDSDPDRRFSYQAIEHVPKEIPQSALPGLNHILNLATITADERDIFSEYAPKHLDDPQLLMNEVLQLREEMMDDGDSDDHFDDVDEAPSKIGGVSPVVPHERDAEVRKAFESFVNLNGNERYIGKI